MTDFRNILEPLASKYALDKLVKLTGKTLIFPFYHMVSDNPPPHIRHLYRVKSIKEFRTDLDDLLKHFVSLSPGWLTDRDKTPGDQKPSFILSFDDGLGEVASTIVPILEEKGVNAIFFLNNDFIGNKGLFYRYKVSLLIDRVSTADVSDASLRDIAAAMDLTTSSRDVVIAGLLKLGYKCSKLISRIANRLEVDIDRYLSENKPYLDAGEIRSLVNKGFYIGAHSHDHPLFFQLESDAQFDEVKSSTEEIKKQFDLDYTFFSFPFSDIGVNQNVLEKLYAQPGKILDASFGTSGLKENEPYPHYQRIPMEKTASRAENYLKSEYLLYRLKRFTGRNVIRRPS